MRASGVFDFSQRLKSNYSGYSKSMKLTGSDGRNSAAGVSGAYPVSTSRLPMIASGGVPVAEIIKTRLRRSVGKVKTTEILARDKGRGVKIADQAQTGNTWFSGAHFRGSYPALAKRNDLFDKRRHYFRTGLHRRFLCFVPVDD